MQPAIQERKQRKHEKEFCKCWARDPICSRCGKPQRLCANWREDISSQGVVYEHRKHVTKKLEKALRALVEWSMKTPLHEMIDMKKVRREWGKVSRQQLRANGIDPKGLSGEECISLSMQHSRAFLGMDTPNVFTGAKA